MVAEVGRRGAGAASATPPWSSCGGSRGGWPRRSRSWARWWPTYESRMGHRTRSPSCLEAEAVAARLRHAQPDGAAAAAAELRAVVGRMGEFLGAAHQ